MIISKVLKLLRLYKFDSIRIVVSILFSPIVKVPVHGRTFYQRKDTTTLYHLLNSYPKIKALVQSLPSDISGIAIDGGANNGLFSFCLHERFPHLHIIAIEPSPLLLPILRRNLAHIPNCTILPIALSSIQGDATFFFCKNADQIGSLSKNNVTAFSGGMSIQSVPIKTASIDTILDEMGITKVSVIKLDLQGAEMDAINGACMSLKNTDSVLVEITLVEPSAFDIMNALKSQFQYKKPVNAIAYGADILFSKLPIVSQYTHV